MVHSLPPYPLWQPFTEWLRRDWYNVAWTIASAADSIKPMVEDATSTWYDLEPLLEEVQDGRHAYFGEKAQVARIEFITERSHFRDARNLRGAVLFDATGDVIVHAVNALLGYGGSGPKLSSNILKAVGAPDSIFNEIQDVTKTSHSYAVIVSRETPTELDEGEAIVTHDEPLRDWSWQRMR